MVKKCDKCEKEIKKKKVFYRYPLIWNINKIFILCEVCAKGFDQLEKNTKEKARIHLLKSLERWLS